MLHGAGLVPVSGSSGAEHGAARGAAAGAASAWPRGDRGEGRAPREHGRGHRRRRWEAGEATRGVPSDSLFITAFLLTLFCTPRQLRLIPLIAAKLRKLVQP